MRPVTLEWMLTRIGCRLLDPFSDTRQFGSMWGQFNDDKERMYT